jgi:hypothetical protein
VLVGVAGAVVSERAVWDSNPRHED